MKTVKTKQIIPPAEGWKPSTLYYVEVAFDPNNVVHKALFYSGFLTEGRPGGYNQIWSPLYDTGYYHIGHAHYLKVVREMTNIEF
jgi:hypothetical protein